MLPPHAAPNRPPHAPLRSAEGLSDTRIGHNLIQDVSACAFAPVVGDITGEDPLLGPLADNGGMTQTHLPDSDSPVIDAGDPAVPGSGGSACLAIDQRGMARPMAGVCDIGAVEIALDTDGDGLLDEVDPDDDNDGVLDRDDCAPLEADAWAIPGLETMGMQLEKKGRIPSRGCAEMRLSRLDFLLQKDLLVNGVTP